MWQFDLIPLHFLQPCNLSENSLSFSRAKIVTTMEILMLRASYLRMTVIQECLDTWFGKSSWRVSVCTHSRETQACLLSLRQLIRGFYRLEIPRRLSQDEIGMLEQRWSDYKRMQNENGAIRKNILAAEPAQGDSGQSSQQSWLSGLPSFSRDSEMLLVINMIPPNLSDIIQVLDNFNRTLGATEKTFQLWTEGLQNKLLANVLFSAEREIEEGETARVFGAIGRPTEKDVVKMVSNIFLLITQSLADVEEN